ncbi:MULTISPECIES: type II toxin-antitoxin system RelE/ParE family toxin [unclassified Marinimicrobium]|jgi:toxin ParE1/3/4|uniref:type II toxin-antitoxin system RelE/ParE family toxin n=1 Tax=unclassified Marinimicrobium TaxID=2632100 RepID=UPI000C4FF512|nr:MULTISPECIES: type II toxin-antitoxin system RelE/ParE family toxin [unclassified Marinimicrobium]MAN52158.1 plasmid stabilization protein [Marinimicrobium sp.]|tara:strand:- start:368 stop:661 length:294 start_codon:yes stop_codon:yes gene_type:complete
MAYKHSNRAVQDFAAIYEYTLLNFGAHQADAYREGLEGFFALLSSSPSMGYECPEIAEGVRRQDYQRHPVIYRRRERDIFILRILRQQMDVISHIFD